MEGNLTSNLVESFKNLRESLGNDICDKVDKFVRDKEELQAVGICTEKMGTIFNDIEKSRFDICAEEDDCFMKLEENQEEVRKEEVPKNMDESQAVEICADNNINISTSIDEDSKESALLQRLRQRRRRSVTPFSFANASKTYRPKKVNLKELETIYEDPVKRKDGTLLSIGLRKIRRCLTFNVTKKKISKRKAMAKKYRMSVAC